MITVAIIAILSAIAIPSYRTYVLRSNRSDALSELTRAQVILERCYAQAYTYVGCANVPTVTPKALYTIALTADSSTYSLAASAQGTQANDSTCTPITINQSNQKTPAACWNP